MTATSIAVASAFLSFVFAIYSSRCAWEARNDLIKARRPRRERRARLYAISERLSRRPEGDDAA